MPWRKEEAGVAWFAVIEIFRFPGPPARNKTCLAGALSAALALAGASCADGDQRFDMVFDPCAPLFLNPGPDATDEQVAIVEETIALWNEVAAVDASAVPVEGARELPVYFDEEIWYFGRFNDVSGVLEVASWIDDSEAMSIVLAHELGHAFYLYHVEPGERVSVMNAGNLEVPPTAGDRDELVAIWGDCSTRASP